MHTSKEGTYKLPTRLYEFLYCVNHTLPKGCLQTAHLPKSTYIV